MPNFSYSARRPQASRFRAGPQVALVLLLALLVGGRTAWAQTSSDFAPTSGPAGTLVTSTGTGLDQVRSVRFGLGGLALFTAQSATSLAVRVPVDAASGPLTLTLATGRAVLSSVAYVYTPRPAGLVATLSPAGSLDACQPRTLTASAASPAFTTGDGFNSLVYSVAVQADGKVLVGGLATTYQGTPAVRLLRLHTDGSRDTSFITGQGFGTTTYSSVRSLAVQADGKLLVGGEFATYQGAAAQNLVRLNANGSRDSGFAFGQGFDGVVYSVAVQADGKVLVGGEFTTYQGAAANKLLRLNADGSRDGSFAAGQDLTGSVGSLVLQADGKVLVGGDFSTYQGVLANGLVRLNADGSRDASFVTGQGFNGYVTSIAVQADGRVVVGGLFSTYQGTPAIRLVRLQADGSRDTSFAVGQGFESIVQSVTVQANGQLLVGGDYTTYQNTPASRLLRLNADGSRDASFAVGQGFNASVRSVAVQADGHVLVGGYFTTFQGSAANYLECVDS